MQVDRVNGEAEDKIIIFSRLGFVKRFILDLFLDTSPAVFRDVLRIFLPFGTTYQFFKIYEAQ